MADGGEAEWSELMSAIHRSVHTQKHLLSLCWVTTLPTSHAADGFTILLQEVSNCWFKTLNTKHRVYYTLAAG